MAVDHWEGEKLAPLSKYYCDKFLSPKTLLEKTISTRRRRKATSRQNRLLQGSWEWGHFEIVCAQHIDGVGDDGGEVSDGGDVENSHDLPRNLPIHWNTTDAPKRTATDVICLVFVADFCFHSKYLQVRCFHISQLFLLDLWVSSCHRNFCNMWVFYWVSDNSTSWICDRISSAFLSFSCKIMTMTFFVKTTKWVSDRVIALSFVIIMAIFCKIGESNNDFFKLWGWFNK